MTPLPHRFLVVRDNWPTGAFSYPTQRGLRFGHKNRNRRTCIPPFRNGTASNRNGCYSVRRPPRHPSSSWVKDTARLTQTGVAVEKLLPAKFSKIKLRQDAL